MTGKRRLIMWTATLVAGGLIAVVFLAWLSFGARAYWFGHFSHLTGSVGKVGELVNQNVGKRTESRVLGRQVVVASRIGLALLTWGLASVSILVQWIRRSTPIAVVCLFMAPFPILPTLPVANERSILPRPWSTTNTTSVDSSASA